MSKQESVNTFTEGLVMDLNPITTPDNVLTNALNATLITYNGNEFVLQNDMGNGRVETAYLPSGYVPVGVKEYGGIIYVASYNPLTNKGQIGSFPSPERNISSNEIDARENCIISSDDFVLPDGSYTFTYRTKLFEDGTVIRSGDKFSIILTSENTTNLKSFVSNCLNTTGYTKDSKVLSPKNKLLTIKVAVLDSSNNFRDITSALRRFDEDNEELIINATEFPLLHDNMGYYMQCFPKLPTNVDEYRKQKAVNTYNNKVFGELYLIATLNTITSLNAAVEGFVNKTNKVITLPDGTTTDKVGTTLLFDLEYTYNCPDGFYDQQPEVEVSDDFKNQYESYYGKQSEFNPDNVIWGSSLERVNREKYKIPFTIERGHYPTFDSATNTYNFKQLSSLHIPETSGIFEYRLTPCMTYSKLNGLQIRGSINIDKLGSGDIAINTWRYYCGPTNITLTWGLEAYPVYGTTINQVRFVLFNVEDRGNKSAEILLPKHRNYNGTFNESIQYTEDGTGIKKGGLYLVRIECDILHIGGNIETKEIGYEWLLATGLYNSLYHNLDIPDFRSDLLISKNKVTILGNVSSESIGQPIIESKKSSELLYPTSTDGFTDCRKYTSESRSFYLSSAPSIENPDLYPFTLGDNKVSSSYSIQDTQTSPSLENLSFVGDYNTYKDKIKVGEDNIERSSITDDFESIQYNYTVSGSTLTISSKLLSQVYGNEKKQSVPVRNLYKKYIDSDTTLERKLGMTTDNIRNFGNYKIVGFGALSMGRGNHDDHHAFELWGFKRDKSGKVVKIDGESDLYSSGRDATRGNKTAAFPVVNYIDQITPNIQKYYDGVLPIVVLLGGIINRDDGRFDAGGAHSETWWVGFGLRTPSTDRGKHPLAKYQAILWYDGSKYVLCKHVVKSKSESMYGIKFITGGTESLAYSIKSLLEEFYIKTSDSSMIDMYTVDQAKFVYNNNYSITVPTAVTYNLSIEENPFTTNNSSFNELVDTTIASIIKDESEKNYMKQLMTFSYSQSTKPFILTEKFQIDGMAQELASLNAQLTTGINSALIANDAIYLKDRFGLEFSPSEIYCLVNDGGSLVPDKASNQDLYDGFIENLEARDGDILVKPSSIVPGMGTINDVWDWGNAERSCYSFEGWKDSDTNNWTYATLNGYPMVNVKIPEGINYTTFEIS